MTTSQIVRHCRDAGRGASAFDVITIENAEANAAGAEAAGLPVIVQVSENAVRFPRGQFRPIAAAAAEIARTARLPVSLHLGHVVSTELLHAAAAGGFASVMFDASTADYAAKVAATCSSVKSRTAMLDHDLITRLREAVTVPLVLHGSSGVCR